MLTLQPIEMVPGGTLGSLGLNLETYFAQDIQDPLARTKRLERAMIAMQKDLRVMAPLLQQINGPNPDLDAVMDSIATQAPENLVQTHAASQQPVGTKSEPATLRAKPVTTPAGNKAVVTGVRVGEHPDRVRVVFDVSQKTTYKADLDNTENLLVVEMPDAGWQMPSTFESFNTPVIKSYKVDSLNSGGHIFILQLKGTTEILSQDKLPAPSGSGERIVIDLRK
jgi:hypothetical protein